LLRALRVGPGALLAVKLAGQLALVGLEPRLAVLEDFQVAPLLLLQFDGSRLVAGDAPGSAAGVEDFAETGGTRGLGPIKERLVGSVAHRVLTFAPGAKLILPCPLKALKQILLPLQGTYDTDHALRFLQKKPFRDTATITLFTVLPQNRPLWPVGATVAEQMESQALRDAEGFLKETAAKLGQMGYQTQVAAALGTPVEGILEKARALSADLILMGSRGRQGVTRVVLGSVSHALLHQGTYPLMIFG